MKTSWTTVIFYIALLILIGQALILNPIHFHQTAQVGSLTMQVPAFWTPVKNPGGHMLLALRREWATSGTVNVMDRTALGPDSGPWTLEDAKRERGYIVVLQAKDSRFSHPQFIDLNAGRYKALCEEALLDRNQALICYIVGTPLQFSYLGSSSYEPDARRMLASLN